MNTNNSQPTNYKIELLCFMTIACLAAIAFFFQLGNYPLFNPDEGLYAEPAREMLETGEYVTTLLNYAVRYTKPPLAIWAMALNYHLFGVNEFSARLFSAICAFLLVLITYLFTNKYLGRPTALISSFILLSSPLFLGVGRMAITDMPLSLFTAGSLFCFYHAWKQQRIFWLWPGYALTGFAVMTKGPVGLLLPALILAIFFLLRKEGKTALKFFHIPLGGILVATIALPWFIVEIATTNGAYFREFILRENFARFTTVVDSHKGAWWYHILAVLGGMFPWSIMLPQSVFNLARNIFRLNRSSAGTLLFLFIWAILTIAFFSISVSKLLPYTLPAFPALAIIIASQWMSLVEKNAKKTMLAYCSAMAFIYLLAIYIAPLALQHLRNHPPELEPVIRQYASLASVLTLSTIFILLRKSKLLASLFCFGTITILTITSLPKVLTVVSRFWEGNIPQYAEFARQSNLPLIVYDLRKPAVPFYFRHRVYQPNDKEELNDLISKLQHGYLITKNKHKTDLANQKCKLIATDRNFALFLY